MEHTCSMRRMIGAVETCPRCRLDAAAPELLRALEELALPCLKAVHRLHTKLFCAGTPAQGLPEEKITIKLIERIIAEAKPS